MAMPEVVFLNPRTCGIYKSGGSRYKTDPVTGKRTSEIDNELIDAVNAYIAGKELHGIIRISIDDIFSKRILVPTYYDRRYNTAIENLLHSENIKAITIGELINNGTIIVRGGHGSPGNDQRTGTIPYIKVSDIRGLRVNVNPTNLVSEMVARRLWRGPISNLCAWDILTPNRASSNIGEFAILLPGEEQIVLTKEVFIFRVINDELINHFYLLWAFSLKAVREQWRRIALMQTNREDCGDRHREIILPLPPTRKWALERSNAFQKYFETLANAKSEFVEVLKKEPYEFVANAIVD